MQSQPSSPQHSSARFFLPAYRNGIENVLTTAREFYWERFANRLAELRIFLHNRKRRLLSSRYITTPRDFRINRHQQLIAKQCGYRATVEALGAIEADIPKLKSAAKVVIGEIDQDGFVRSEVGTLNGIPTVTEDKFMPRMRFGLTLIARNGVLAMRKDYRGDRQAFWNEIRALEALAQAGCNVPSLLEIDFTRLQIEMSYIVGTVVREALARHGAIVRDRDVEKHEIGNLSRKEKRLARIQEGRSLLCSVVDDDFIEHLYRQLRTMHSLCFIWSDIKYGNVLIEKESRQPYIIDFDRAKYYPKLDDRAFRLLADRDIDRFNFHFDTNKLTMGTLRRRANAIPPSEITEPACFTGLSIGNIWDRENGYGRWHFLLKHALPPAEGARILDIGANNGFNALQLLRNGAREVIGVECDDTFVEQGHFLHEAYEYLDRVSYDFRYLHVNMKDIITMELGRFDFVMALRSIYHVNDRDIKTVADFLSTITDTLILQCDTDPQPCQKGQHSTSKASVEYGQEILTSAGFSKIDVISPSHYNRPLLIGQRST